MQVQVQVRVQVQAGAGPGTSNLDRDDKSTAQHSTDSPLVDGAQPLVWCLVGASHLGSRRLKLPKTFRLSTTSTSTEIMAPCLVDELWATVDGA